MPGRTCAVWLAWALTTSAALADDTVGSPNSPDGAVTVLEVGRRPHALTVTATVGDAWALQIRRTSTSTTVVDGGDPAANDAPEAVHELGAVVQGTAEAPQLALALQDASLQGAPMESLAAIQSALLDLSDTRIVIDADPHQRSQPGVQDLPEYLDPIGAELLGDVGWALGLVAVPLPEEAVGKGARWTWSRPAVEQGVPVDQVLTATLLKRKRDKVVLALEIGMAATDTADGAAISLQAKGSGTVWLSLDRPLVQAASLDLRGDVSGTWADDAGDHTIRGAFQVHLTVASRDVGQPEDVAGR